MWKNAAESSSLYGHFYPLSLFSPSISLSSLSFSFPLPRVLAKSMKIFVRSFYVVSPSMTYVLTDNDYLKTLYEDKLHLCNDLTYHTHSVNLHDFSTTHYLHQPTDKIKSKHPSIHTPL